MTPKERLGLVKQAKTLLTTAGRSADDDVNASAQEVGCAYGALAAVRDWARCLRRELLIHESEDGDD